MFQSNKKDQISSVTRQYLVGRLTMKYQNRRSFWFCYQRDLLIGGVILCSVINRPKNKSFLVTTSDSIEFRPEIFSSKEPGANSGT